MHDIENDIISFMSENLDEFRPFAYFDKHMDCIRVLIQNVSVVEERVSELFTVARPAHPSSFSGRHVGFTIKGVAHLFNELNLPVEGVYQMVDLLDGIVKKIPHTAVKRVVDEFDAVLRLEKMYVNMSAEQELLAA